MIKHNQKRFDPENPDFIIPFLIHHSTEGIAKPQPNIKKKRYSVSTKHKDINTNSSMELAKIYKTHKKEKQSQKQQKEKSPQRSDKKVKAQKFESQQHMKEEQILEKGKSQLELSLVKSPYIARNRFFKAHSLINHMPAYNNIEEFIELKASPQRIDKDSPIPGIRFKRKMMFNESANLITPQVHDQENKNEFVGKIKHWRQKKQWNRKRSANVDFIINRKCKNFNDLIAQYRKRLTLPQTAQVFIFNSKDYWLKRVLTERGWIENSNKQSRAFHLYWSSKVYKEPVFPEQLINHYRSSDLLTSKAGLHRMLLKYSLTHLQPITFDLNLQKDQFLTTYNKLAFISKLKKLISKFQFEEDAECTSFQELKIQLTVLKDKSKKDGVIESDLIGLIDNCFILLDGKFQQLTTYYIDRLLLQIHSMLKINPIQEELIRLVRDFQFLSKKHRLFQRQNTIGSENIWLTKSKNSSKGVGISLHKDLDSIFKHQNRLVQKYIQNPLIFKDPSINGRKFDIRVWVLLVGNLKAKLYYHQKFYGRLCFQPYSLETINLDNQKKHLTNYSQNKISFRDSTLANSILIPDAIFQLILQQRGIDFRNQFYVNIENILSKMAVIFKHEIAAGNSNSFELFGLDLLIDNDLNLHLLEVNLSAACEERHEALTDMMEDVAHGMINILEGNSSGAELRGWKPIK